MRNISINIIIWWCWWIILTLQEKAFDLFCFAICASTFALKAVSSTNKYVRKESTRSMTSQTFTFTNLLPSSTWPKTFTPAIPWDCLTISFFLQMIRILPLSQSLTRLTRKEGWLTRMTNVCRLSWRLGWRDWKVWLEWLKIGFN